MRAFTPGAENNGLTSIEATKANGVDINAGLFVNTLELYNTMGANSTY